MKRILATLTTIIIVFSLIPISAIAESTAEPEYISLKDGQPYAAIINSAIASKQFVTTTKSSNLLKVCETIYKSLANGQTTVPFASTSLDYNTVLSNFSSAITILQQTCPYLFGWDSISSCDYDLDDEKNITLYFTLKRPVSECIAKFNEYEALLDDIVKTVPQGLSDIGKVFYIYNYLPLNFEYDLSYTIYDGYNLLTQKKGVCQAYTEVFNSLMFKLGIPCTNAMDKPDLHIWNIVKLDGKYYHVDSTFADPTPDAYGRVHESFFLLSDSLISKASDHSTYTTYDNDKFGYSVSCEDTTYDTGYLWNNSVSPFAFYGGEFYYIENSGIYSGGGVIAYIYKTSDFINKQFVTAYNAPLLYFYDKNGNKTDYIRSTNGIYAVLSGISFVGSQLYYNTCDKIMFYDVSNKTSGVVYSSSTLTDLNYCYYTGGGNFRYSALKLVIGDDGYVQSFDSYDNGVVSVLDYDIDGDGELNAFDVSILRRYILTGENKFSSDSKDITLCLSKLNASDQHTVSVIDLVKMKKLCAVA